MAIIQAGGQTKVTNSSRKFKITPRMPRDPVTAKEYEHNEKVKNWSNPMLYYAMVARTVKRDEVMNNPKARQACDE